MKKIKLLSIEELNARIESDNKEFEAMSAKDKRITIAQDCLIRLDLQQVKAETNRFVDTDTIEEYLENNELSYDTGVKEILGTAKFKCTACAKGALFLSYVGRVNNYVAYDIVGGNSVYDSDHEKLSEIFPLKQLAVIEYAFEGAQYLDIDEKRKRIKIENREAIDEWRKQFLIEKDYPEDMDAFDKDYRETDLLVAICENIIDNDGEFTIK